ncbi:hypothetical protein [Mycolicibacterium fortuitum]|uniref:Uncharacterized protein n=2 Tax=Mycolicibacterium fortuitum TaxID=1766 RepID=A0AAE5AHG4_MYCFO|nr:hypothetical protein [Mycolicibacterium fortuitum]MCV7137566.1 hypothetical protein [Mycolicibacterium fortuitum]MDV7195660.1 hypothetical protein [Mycolicibacterium fortuitum]MDV7209335.1 hypothetical protein [Mycolicibacterium fortuitum]MDV7231173.1 hypothetical protein [Mycolicibacterium fortuitum]MDV7262742.1 hypothetical protein [Mycolicibacterium fortuitum]
MAFTVKLSDGGSVDFPDSATYTFEPHGVLAVRARRDGQRYEHTTRRFAPLRWFEVVAGGLHEPAIGIVTSGLVDVEARPPCLLTGSRTILSSSRRVPPALSAQV